mmetsp:Transcript_19521/g.33402  ORF Transcript_19521/g.33402 Transcript_19521/m.33402 type:complete len:100 (+) Transcript_19521:128-427(+)
MTVIVTTGILGSFQSLSGQIERVAGTTDLPRCCGICPAQAKVEKHGFLVLEEKIFRGANGEHATIVGQKCRQPTEQQSYFTPCLRLESWMNTLGTAAAP